MTHAVGVSHLRRLDAKFSLRQIFVQLFELCLPAVELLMIEMHLLLIELLMLNLVLFPSVELFEDWSRCFPRSRSAVGSFSKRDLFVPGRTGRAGAANERRNEENQFAFPEQTVVSGIVTILLELFDVGADSLQMLPL